MLILKKQDSKYNNELIKFIIEKKIVKLFIKDALVYKANQKNIVIKIYKQIYIIKEELSNIDHYFNSKFIQLSKKIRSVLKIY